MKKQFKNILIIILIIIGIISVWFAKNKDDIFEIEEDNEVEIIEDNNINKMENEDEKVETEENIVEDNKTEIEENNEVSEVIIAKNDPNFELSTPSFDVETLKTYGLPILLDFGAEWCGPCQIMHPILEELNSELRGKVIIKYVDIDNYLEAAKGFNFTLIPTQYFITSEGEIYKSHTGIISKEDIISILKEMGMEE